MRIFLFFIPLIIISCKSLSGLPAIEKEINNELSGIDKIFLDEKYRLVHSIRTELPDKTISSLVGITLADPVSREIEAVLMTVEGLVVFEAKSGSGQVKIVRAVDQLNTDDFASALMEDISFIFFRPHCDIEFSGKLKDGSPVKRFIFKSKKIVDIVGRAESGVVVNMYDSSRNLIKTAVFSEMNNDGLPVSIELLAHGFFGYTMRLDLIEYERIEGDSER